MFERAIRERWPIPETHRSAIITKLMKVILSNESTTREVVSACRAVISADKINVDLEVPKAAHTHQHLHLEGGVSMEEFRQQILNDPQYLDYLRSQAVAHENGNACVVRSSGISGAMEAGPASDHAGQADR